MSINKYCLVIISILFATKIYGSNLENFKLIGKIFISNYISKKIQKISYTGHIKLELIEIEADQGELFVLINVHYNADLSLKNKMDPSKIYLEVNSVSYKRIRNVNLFEDFEIRWFPFIKINFGKHEGFLLFKIPDNEKIESIQLVYKNNIIKINQYESSLKF